MRVLMMLLVGLGVAGCTTPAERLARDNAVCESYGFRPGTDAMAQCRQQRARDRAQALDAILAAPAYRAPVHCYTAGAVTNCY